MAAWASFPLLASSRGKGSVAAALWKGSRWACLGIWLMCASGVLFSVTWTKNTRATRSSRIIRAICTHMWLWLWSPCVKLSRAFFPWHWWVPSCTYPIFDPLAKAKEVLQFDGIAAQERNCKCNWLLIEILYIYIYIYKYKYIYTHTFVYKHVYSQSMSYLRKAAEGVLSAVRRERVLFLLLLFLLKCCSLCFWAKDVSAALLGSLLLNRRAFPAINMHGKCRFCCSEQSCSLVMCQALAI